MYSHSYDWIVPRVQKRRFYNASVVMWHIFESKHEILSTAQMKAATASVETNAETKKEKEKHMHALSTKISWSQMKQKKICRGNIFLLCKWMPNNEI